MRIQDRLKTIAPRICVIALAGLLTACGGGGSSSTDTATQTDPSTTSSTSTTWVTRQQGISGGFTGVVWDGDKYLAVSDGSGLYSSQDGINWQRVSTSGFGGNFNIAYKNGMYLSGGDWQTVYTSADGVNWDSHSLCETTTGCFSEIYALTGNVSGYVAAGEDGLLYFSSDGSSWSVQDGFAGAYESFLSAAASPDRFVVAGTGRGVIYSDSGTVWSEGVFDTTTTPLLLEVIWTGTQFVGVGYDGIYASTDGATWTFKSAQTAEHIVWTGTQYETLSYSSTDLVNWTVLPRSQRFYDTDRLVQAFHYLPATGQYLMAGGDYTTDLGWIASSPDGSTWSMDISSHDMTAVTWAGDHFEAIDGTGVLFESTDGVEWSSSSLIKIEGDGIVETYKDIAWSPSLSRYIAVSSQRIATSLDGKSWTDTGVNHGAVGGFTVAKWLNNQFVVTGYNGFFDISSDGVNWSSPGISGDITTTPVIQDVAWSDMLGLYAAVDLSGTVYTSPDASNWTEYNAVAPNGLRAITWGGGQFVAVGTSGTVMTSPDGVNWTDRSGSYSSFYDVLYDGGYYYAVSSSGEQYISSDGYSWGLETTDNAEALAALASNGSRVIAVGSKGTITSRP